MFTRTETLTLQDLDELERLEKEATYGPWRLVWHGTERYPFPLSIVTVDERSWVTRDGTASSEANANLITEMRNALPELLKLARAGIESEIAGDRESELLGHIEDLEEQVFNLKYELSLAKWSGKV
jgi:hypothetical protein